MTDGVVKGAPEEDELVAWGDSGSCVYESQLPRRGASQSAPSAQTKERPEITLESFVGKV